MLPAVTGETGATRCRVTTYVQRRDRLMAAGLCMPAVVLLIVMLMLEECSPASSGTNGSPSADREAGYRALEQHAWQQGLRFPKVEIREDAETGARGLFVKQEAEIAAGEPLVVVPASFALISTHVLERLRRHSMSVVPEIQALSAPQLLVGRLLQVT